jgi:hypothetical protein
MDEWTGNIKLRGTRIAEIKERRAWNIDNICTTTSEKSIVNQNSSSSLKAEDFEPTGIIILFQYYVFVNIIIYHCTFDITNLFLTNICYMIYRRN